MKNTAVLITVITALALMAAGCNKNVVPNTPYDMTPTPTGEATNRVNITVIDSDMASNTKAANNLDIILRYPGNFNRAVSAAAVSGTAELYVYDHGTYTIEIPPNTLNGYSNSVFDTVNVNGEYTSKTITRYEPINLLFVTPAVTTWDKNGGTYTYTFTYQTITPRRITFTVQTNATSDVQYWFEPANELINNNDTIQFKIFIPKYYQVSGEVYNGLAFSD